MANTMYANDPRLKAAFKKRSYDSPNLGTNRPNLGPAPEYNPRLDNYPEELHHRIIYAAMQCGSSMGKGWYDLVLELDDAISKIYPFYTIDQVKEKFGGLRYYIGELPATLPDAQRKQINDLISEAEERSLKTCEVCGEPGERKLIDKYLIATRCMKHDKER